MELAFPLLLKEMLEWVSEEEADQLKGYLIAGALTLVLGVKSYMNIIGSYFTDNANAKVRSSVKVRKKILFFFLSFS